MMVVLALGLVLLDITVPELCLSVIIYLNAGRRLLYVKNRTVQRGCADSTAATVAAHTVGEGENANGVLPR